ncbi:tetratricopeptide repeat protein [Paracraurococcus lichenis]|uniref:Tetratricopeptide repeat protein n=1 Tax=Paracraurococcus lichenis TaxID=3064888 RepID=A0ABT9DSX5_9PROT|nr:tetratricopeptide repeat protein [Paracraurococcus sp. LOR1-02]MDO9707005.1 tetratricopeptide repeat protein [Paracraurococcus sp. LOR1-02]
MADIFDEVEEDLRAERMRRLLSRYGSLLIGAALLVLLGVAGLQGWRWYEARGAAQAAGAYLAAGRDAAQPNADTKAIAQRYDALAAGAPEGYRTLARLRAAALKAEWGDRAGALADWDAVARDGGTDALYRGLATLLWALHALDGGDAAAIESRLAPLAEGPWRASVEEVRALAAMQRNDTATAKRLLTGLRGDIQAPQGVRDRAGRLLAELGG